MPDSVYTPSMLFKIYDEYKSSCFTIINNIETEDIDYLVELVNIKGDILKNMLRLESIVELTDENLKKKNAYKAELLEIENKTQDLFRARYQKIKDELQKVRKNKKLVRAYSFSVNSSGKRVNIIE